MFDKNTHTLSSPYDFNLEGEFPKEENLVEYLLNRASLLCRQGHGAVKWIINAESGEFTTYSEIEPLSRKIASSMKKRGIRQGDVVVYSSHEILKLHIFFLGIWRANGALRACYPDEDRDNIRDKIIESKSRWFLCDSRSLEQVSEAVKQVPWSVEIIVFGQDEKAGSGSTIAEALFEDDGEECPELLVGGNDMAFILATSGTTGPCKGALYTHKGFIKTIVTRQKCLLNDESSPFISLGKQTHISGSTFPWIALLASRTILMIPDVTNQKLLSALHTYQPSLVIGFPKFLQCLVDDPLANNYDLSSLRHILVAGVVITPNFISQMESLPGVRVVIYYGMTECGVFSTTNNCNPSSSQVRSNDSHVWEDVPAFSVGKLTPGTSMQVRDLETNKLLGANQQGELVFKNSIICSGYVNRPKESKEAFPEGWVKTGDVGYFDENGFIFVVDRCKEIFKYYNNHISPSELENVINRHPGVGSSCVIGVPDPAGGDRIPRAFVTLKDPSTLAQDILAFANEHLAPFKQIRGGLIVLPSLPVGKSGKVSRLLLNQVQIAFPSTILS